MKNSDGLFCRSFSGQSLALQVPLTFLLLENRQHIADIARNPHT
jgi:hypothetical protein